MPREITTEVLTNMATLDVCLFMLVFICRICTALVKTNVLELEQTIEGESAVSYSVLIFVTYRLDRV